MSYRNTLYDPKWKDIRDLHDREHNKYFAIYQNIIMNSSKGQFLIDDATYNDTLEKVKYHLSEYQKSFKIQFELVEDYAEWLFTNFPLDLGICKGEVIVPIPDFYSFKSVNEADLAWSSLRKDVQDAESQKLNGLSIGQPDGLMAFSDPASVVISWRHFHLARGVVRTLVTMEERDDGWHVCFMHDWSNAGPSVTHTVEHLASAVYDEICAIAESQTPKENGLMAAVRKLSRRGKKPILDHKQFHFYEHAPPNGAGTWREQFDQVRLKFHDGRFLHPEWRGYPMIPAAIQSARVAQAMEASEVGNEPMNLLEYQSEPMEARL